MGASRCRHLTGVLCIRKKNEIIWVWGECCIIMTPYGVNEST